MTPSSESLRPRDLALLLLAGGDCLPRQRARDQEADRFGLALKRRLLDRLAAFDPEPGELSAALDRIVQELGEPTGPTRAVALSVLDDWQAACAAPEWVAHLLHEATHQSEEGRSHGRRVAR
jgi:hypothetical protein